MKQPAMPSSTPSPAPRICRLQADSRGAVEDFFRTELDDVALYWRFFRTMTPATVRAHVQQIPFARGGAVFGAFVGERLAGVAELAAAAGERCRQERSAGPVHCAELGIAVAGRQRRQGLARALLVRLLHHAWAHGVQRVQLSSLKGNHPMLRLAESLGFQAVGEHSGEIIMQLARPAGWTPEAAVGPDEDQAPDPAGASACEGERNCTVRMFRGCCE